MRLPRLEKVYKTIFPVLQVGAGAFVIAYGWGSYHFNKHSVWYLPQLLLLGVAAVVFFYLFKGVYIWAAKRKITDYFWRETVVGVLERFFLLSSLIFGLFLFRSEWQSLLYTIGVGILLFWQTKRVLQKHHLATPWLSAHTSWFTLGFFILILQMIVQYAAYHYYILDTNIKFFNIVLFRSIAMTLFWLLLFAILFLCGIQFKSKWRYAGISIWLVIFLFMLFAWAVNIAVLYYSGLYISPVALGHAEGAGEVAMNVLTLILVAGWLVAASVTLFILRRWVKHETPLVAVFHKRYAFLISSVALLALLGLSSFRNTPERAVLASFYDAYFGNTTPIELDSTVAEKLEKFGLFYNKNDFYVNRRQHVFATSTPLLPERFNNNPPNVIIIFLESFSARLTGVYNDDMKEVTPNFNEFATDPQVTVFKKYFNASTPTITGTLSQLCSFLPPTGHNEIQNERKLQGHHLLCLPEVLKKYAGFKHSAYVTAVDKSYAHKDGIFESMLVDEVWGTGELSKIITEEPLSWGYSDHQLFPAFFDLSQKAPQPFLMMLATVDTHPPYNLPKDAVNYKDGSQPVLNMVHTTDHAFGEFWESFKASPRYNDTIVVAVGDHAIFPAALTKDVFPDDAGTLTYYDENFFAMYVPDSVLPKTVDIYSSGLDLTPTLLHMFNINVANSFEGYSIFGERKQFPNLLGMHELGLYINQINEKGRRMVDYNVPSEITCPESYFASSTPVLTLCDYVHFYRWKRQMFEQGRFWKKE